MSVAILFNQKESAEWFEKLQALLPETKVEVYPAIEHFDEVEFIATWKPHLGYVNEFPNLKVVQSVGAGIDHLLHTPIPSSTKICRIVDPALKQEMFEHVLACILSSMKKILPYYQAQKEKKWHPVAYQSINATTITVLGLGEIGKLVAEKLAILGFCVKGWSNSKKELDGIQSFAGKDELELAVKESHFVVNILPLTAETENILNADLFSSFSPKTVLINVGRGAHLVENELIDALNNGQISEAYLDVFREEPLPKNHVFWTMNQIYITPHIASVTNASTALNQVADNYKRMKRKQTLMNEVSLTRGY